MKDVHTRYILNHQLDSCINLYRRESTGWCKKRFCRLNLLWNVGNTNGIAFVLSCSAFPKQRRIDCKDPVDSSTQWLLLTSQPYLFRLSTMPTQYFFRSSWNIYRRTKCHHCDVKIVKRIDVCSWIVSTTGNPWQDSTHKLVKPALNDSGNCNDDTSTTPCGWSFRISSLLEQRRRDTLRRV